MRRLTDLERIRRGEQEDEDRRTRSLAGLAVILLVAVLGLFLIQKLAEVSRIEDCLLQGRTNCAPQE